MVMVGGDPWDLEALEKEFDAGDDPRLIVDRDDRFLQSAEVQGIDDEADAEAKARELIAMINGAMRIQHGSSFEPVRFAGLVTFKSSGGRDYYDRGVVNLRIRVRGDDEHRDARGNLVPPPPSPVPAWVGHRSDPAVAAVLRILGRSELDWYDLYKVYESVQHDAGARVKQWAGAAEIERFTHTANNAGALGDAARHADQGWQEPAKPMTHTEATVLVQSLARQWLETK